MFSRIAQHITQYITQYMALPTAMILGLALTLPASAEEIAVLLPQKGRLTQVGLSLRDGLLAAYYQDSLTHTNTPRLRFYDSSDSPAPELVALAANQGASIVIGPLDRDQVQALLNDGSPPVTVIALNRGEGSQPNLIQMALAPEDEISTLVQWMKSRGIQAPHMLAQADDTTASRFLARFEEAWQPADGRKLPSHYLDSRQKGGIAASIKALKDSTKGADSFFLASPGITSQVQPALTYYGMKTALFSLSSAWDPSADTASLNDLDGLGFCGLPWLLSDTGPEQQALYEAQPRPLANHDRLYALGADAWTVARSLTLLRHGDALDLRTGQLRLTNQGHLTRLPTCAEIRHGMATVLLSPPPPDNADHRR